MQAEFSDTHDCRFVGEEGWWESASDGVEKESEYEQRINRAIIWLKSLVMRLHSDGYNEVEHKYRHKTSVDMPTVPLSPTSSSKAEVLAGSSIDHVVIISHADFFNSMLSELLGMDNPCGATYSFVHDNAGVSHIELSFDTSVVENQSLDFKSIGRNKDSKVTGHKRKAADTAIAPPVESPSDMDVDAEERKLVKANLNCRIRTLNVPLPAAEASTHFLAGPI
jgi:hypothetical protein